MNSSQEIDAIIKKSADWRGKKLSELRTVIKLADPDVVGVKINLESLGRLFQRI